MLVNCAHAHNAELLAVWKCSFLSFYYKQEWLFFTVLGNEDGRYLEKYIKDWQSKLQNVKLAWFSGCITNLGKIPKAFQMVMFLSTELSFQPFVLPPPVKFNRIYNHFHDIIHQGYLFVCPTLCIIHSTREIHIYYLTSPVASKRSSRLFSAFLCYQVCVVVE